KFRVHGSLESQTPIPTAESKRVNLKCYVAETLSRFIRNANNRMRTNSPPTGSYRAVWAHLKQLLFFSLRLTGARLSVALGATLMFRVLSFWLPMASRPLVLAAIGTLGKRYKK